MRTQFSINQAYREIKLEQLFIANRKQIELNKLIDFTDELHVEAMILKLLDTVKT